MNKPWWKSTAIWGGIVWSVAKIVAPAASSGKITDGDVDAIIGIGGQALGAVMAVWGLRKAVAKNGNGQ